MFEKLYSATTGEFFNTWIDRERNLMIHQPHYLMSANKYQLDIMSNEGEVLNNFYNQYPDGVEGTVEECIEKVKGFRCL